MIEWVVGLSGAALWSKSKKYLAEAGGLAGQGPGPAPGNLWWFSTAKIKAELWDLFFLSFSCERLRKAWAMQVQKCPDALAG